MDSVNYIVVEPSAQKGIVYGTEFTFDVDLPGTYVKFVWNTGDGNTFYDKKQIKHTFNYPGIYAVTLSAWNLDEQLYTYSVDINVDFAFRDAIKFSKTPETFNHPGKPNYDPFVLSLTSSKIDAPLAIILQPFNTKSVPYYAVPDKWRHVVPTWRFLDSNHNVLIDNLLHVTPTPIYNEQSKQIAVSAELNFYYIDDLSTDFDSPDVCPLLLGASLSTLHFTFPQESLIYPYASYSNNETVKAILPWRVSSNLPTSLKITDNGLDEINPTKWIGVTIPTMLTMEFDPAVFDEDVYEWEVPNSRVINYPKTNELGAKNPVVVTLSCVSNNEAELIPGVHYTVPEDLKFKATDEQGNIAAGYIFTSVTPLSSMFVDKELGGAGLTSGDSFVIQASTVVTNGSDSSLYFEFPKGYPIRNYVFVSHPHGKVINKTVVDSYPRACTSINYYLNQGLTIEEGDLYFLQTPALTTTNIVNLTLSGTAAVYGIAFNPIKDIIYACDADQNTLMSFDTSNNMITSIQLSSYFNNENIGPCHITLDKKFNVWVSLYDSKRILKFDSKLNFLLSAVPQELISHPEAEMFPPVIETDRFSNLWACWYNDVGSALIKFNRYGRQIAVAKDLPSNATPVSLAITPSNTVWVACKRLNSLFHYDENGNLLEIVSDKFISPSYIAIDRYARLWVAHGYNLCSLYDTYNKTLQTWKFGSYVVSEDQEEQGVILIDRPKLNVIKLSSEPIELTTENWLEQYVDEMWGGLSVDVFNRVWVIDSVHNVMGAFNPSTPTYIATSEVKPLVNIMPVIKIGEEGSTFVPSKIVKSAQASGDWTGNKWYQKYAKTYDNLPINGQSTPFKIYNPNLEFNLTKVNESFDLSKYLKSLGYTGTLINSPKFFDEVITGIVGTNNPIEQGLGRIIYEKIANFVLNHSDVETNEISQLMSLADMMGVDYRDYKNNLPVDIARLVNLFSIPKNNLRGITSKKEPENSTELAEMLGHTLTNTDSITAEQLYLLKDKKTDKYELVTATIDETKGSVYGIMDFFKGNSIIPIFETHVIYHYDRNKMKDVYRQNIIDWDSEYTTVNWNVSSYGEWYGENGLVEKMFNKILTKQLFEE